MEKGNKRKCIIFGCGDRGTAAYSKLDLMYDVIAWADNNSQLWRKRKEHLPIINPKQLQRICDHYGDSLDIIIAMDAYAEVVEQLGKLKLPNVLVYQFGFLYRWEEKKLFPVHRRQKPFDKPSEGKLRILFAQWRACIRTNKLASALKKAGHEVYLLYLVSPPIGQYEEYMQVYDGVFSAFSPEEALNFVRDSDFDLIHSSNFPDFLTVLLLHGNTPVVHDSHDMGSIAYQCTPEDMALEYIANTKSSGIIYMTEPMRECAIIQYNIPREKTFVMGNCISEDFLPTRRRGKLSSLDGELHCVYEGGVTRVKEHPKYFEKLWPELASLGIHIHFYAPGDKKYFCELEKMNPNYIHYEGDIGPRKLANELGQYDVGLGLYQLGEQSRNVMEFSSPNKLYEFVNAGIPVAIGNVGIHRDFIEKNGFGRCVTLDETIGQQLREIAKIQIRDNALKEMGYTMESQTPQLVDFYRQCISRFREG